MPLISIGIRRRKDNITLDVLYPKIILISDTTGFPQESGFHTVDEDTLKKIDPNWQPIESDHNGYAQIDVGLFILHTPNDDVKTAEEGYLKLQAISQRIVKPHVLNLNGLFGKLENLAWTNKGPIRLEDVEEEKINSWSTNAPLTVSHVDKFPYLVNYHVPSGVRIASGSQVRLGAYLSEGTTIMPAGYVNFNAGTLGPAMIEGRVSAGVVIDKNSDVGGGASIMGTLSGGNEHVISIGSQCLLGANAGTGISLGNGCTIAAGLYIYAGMKISLYNENNTPININNDTVQEGENVVKALELSGKDYLLFIQDSQSGKVSCKPNTKVIKLNESLHTHN